MDSLLRAWIAWMVLFAFGVLPVTAKSSEFVFGTSVDGVSQQLSVARTPALYTGDFGDCLGGKSLFDVTKFDAAYYTDNSTVLFHLDGRSRLVNENLAMRFSMDAYGENRFEMTFDPCHLNIYSLCPLDTGVPVTAWASFNVGPQQVGSIPALAFTIPDFEGSVKLQIFGNSTQSEIGCFQASLNNGNTMAYPMIISPVLAISALVAMVAAFATAAYGATIPTMRTHYAHSLSVMVVFETFQSIFFSGALQLDFPRVLSAWWSNFAWAAGQIHSQSVLNTADIYSQIGGNASQVGDAGSSVDLVSNAGTALTQLIYGDYTPVAHKSQPRAVSATSEALHLLSRRYNASDPFDYTWAGMPVHPGVVLPGTFTGFPGTLGAVNIPAADTLAVGLIWLFVLVAFLSFALVGLKFSLEALVKMKRVKEDTLAYFRSHWIQYTIITVLRTLFAAFAMVMTLAFYQLSFGGSAGTKALASIFFLLFFVGLSGLVIHACYTRLKGGRLTVQPDRALLLEKLGRILFLIPTRLSTLEKSELLENPVVSVPWFRLEYQNPDPDRVAVTQDEPYIQKLGWLSARYRRTRWWFFAVYLPYQLFRAAIVGGGSSTPKAQVCGLLIYDIAFFLVILSVNPFEGRRNTALAVWMLGISKILTTALSIAFLPHLKTSRIIATAFGIIIVIIQSLLAISVLILIILSAISSYISTTRDRAPDDPSAPASPLNGESRARYLAYLEQATLDVHLSRAEKARLKQLAADAPAPEPSFTLRSVKRVRKIYEEEEADDAEDYEGATLASLGSGVRHPHHPYHQHSRDNSTGSSSGGGGSSGSAPPRPPPPVSVRSARSSSSGSTTRTSMLPRAPRAVRAHWTAADFAEWDAQQAAMQRQRPEPGLAKWLNDGGAGGAGAAHSQRASVLGSLAERKQEEEEEAAEEEEEQQQEEEEAAVEEKQQDEEQQQDDEEEVMVSASRVWSMVAAERAPSADSDGASSRTAVMTPEEATAPGAGEWAAQAAAKTADGGV